MIDFENGKYLKLKAIDVQKTHQNILDILVDGEMVMSLYKSIRDFVVFTNKRIIAVNVQDLLGNKKDFTSIPYSKITTFSIETAGTFDIDSELEIYLSGVGRVHFEFSGGSDILRICRLISEYALR